MYDSGLRRKAVRRGSSVAQEDEPMEGVGAWD